MIKRILRFSWLAATLLVPLVLLSQTSQTPQTTTAGQSTAPGQTATPAQATAWVAEAAGSGLQDDLRIHMINPLISEAVQAAPALTCRQRCALEYNLCLKTGHPNSQCEAIENSCLSKC
jgi:hypothetical protein